jgi:hypothetical protein
MMKSKAQQDEARRIVALWEISMPSKIASDNPLSGIVHALSTKIEAIRAALKEVTSRTEPFGIYLCGNPGVGKTRLAKTLEPYLAYLSGRESITSYQRTCEDYWSGYYGQTIVHIDDLCQVTDDPRVNELFTAISSASYTVNMASLADKGRAMTSDFVIATGNNECLKPNGVTSHAALERRFKVFAKMEKDDTGTVCFRLRNTQTYPLSFRKSGSLGALASRKEGIDGVGWSHLMCMEDFLFSIKEIYSEHVNVAHNGDPLMTCVNDVIGMMKHKEEEYHSVADQGEFEAEAGDEEEEEELIIPQMKEPIISSICHTIADFFKSFFATETDPSLLELVGLKVKEPILNGTTRLTRKVKELFDQFIETITQHKVLVGMLLLLATVGVGSFYFLKGCNTIMESQGASGEYDYEMARKARRRVIKKVQPRRPMIAHVETDELCEKEQMTYDTLSDRTLDYWHNRLFTCVCNGKAESICTVLALGSGIFVFPNHALNDKSYELQLIGSKTNFFISHSVHNIILRDVEHDFCFCQYDITGISNLKQDKIAEDRQKHSRVKFYTASKDAVKYTNGEIHYVRGAYELAETTMVDLEYAHKGSRIAARGFFYTIESSKGLCGSLLLTASGNLIGLHMAGNGNQGFAQPFTRETLTKVDKLRKPQFSEEPYIPSNVVGETKRSLFLQAESFGAISPPAFVPSQTSIRPTIFNEHFAETQQPAILHTKDPRNTERRNILCFNSQKMFSDQFVMDRSKSHAITQHLISYFKNLMAQHGRSSFTKSTIDEAVSGLNEAGEKREGYTSLNITSSNGYPFTGIQLFDRGEGNIPLPGPELRKVVAEMESKIENGERPDAYFSLLLKDETRPLEKIKAGKTRTFMGSNKPFVVLSRMYFGDFIAFLHEMYIDTPSSVGIDANGSDWGRLYDHLISVSDKVIEADFTNWDGSVSFSLYRIACDVINALYSDGNDVFRQKILYEYANATFVCLGNAYRRVGGLPSGCFGTAEFNSLFNWIIHLYAFQRCIEENKLNYGLWDFYDHISLHVYGDDVVMTVSEDLQPYFTPDKVNTWLSEIGFTMTNGDKTALTSEFKDIKDAHFLKRDFHVTEDGVFGRLDLSVIENALRWTMANKDEEQEVLQQTIDSCLEALIGYGEEVYNQYVDKMRRIAPKYVYKDFCFYYQRWCSKQPAPTTMGQTAAKQILEIRNSASEYTLCSVVMDSQKYIFCYGSKCNSNWKTVNLNSLNSLVFPPLMPKKLVSAIIRYFTANINGKLRKDFVFTDAEGLVVLH